MDLRAWLLATGLLLAAVEPVPAATTGEQIHLLKDQIEQKTVALKTALKNQETEQAKRLRAERTDLQEQLRDLKQQAKAEANTAKKAQRKAAAERQWETYPEPKKLCTAIEFNRLDLVQKVLEKPGSLDLKQPNPDCFFPLSDAASNGETEIVEYLLKQGSPLVMQMPHVPVVTNVMDSAASSKEDRSEIMTLLKQHSAKPTYSRENVLPPAVENKGDAEVDAYLKEHYNITRGELGEVSTLERALSRGHPANVRWLLDNGADPNGYALGRTVLMVAVEANSLEKVRLLVQAGADVNQRGVNYVSALRQAERRLQAASNKRKPELQQIVQYLKEQGATHSNREPR